MVLLGNTLRSIGHDPYFDIVLFDKNASNPYRGANGTKTLKEDLRMLIDVGAHLYGYSSYICRCLIPCFKNPVSTHGTDGFSDSVKKKIRVWDIIFEVQPASLPSLVENATAAAVEVAERTHR